MNDLSKNVKKPNIFKRLRIKLFLMQKKSIFEKYLKAPDYVKTYPEAIDKLVEFYEEIPEEVIGIVIDKFSVQQQVEFLNNYENKMSITDMDKCSENIASIMFEEVKQGIYISLPLIKNIDGPTFEINLMNRLSGEWPNFTSEFKQIAKYFDPNKVIGEDLELVKYFDEDQQLGYAKKRKNFNDFFKYFSIDLQLKYIKEYPEYIKFLSYEAAEKFLINSKNPENLALINPKYQIEIIKKNPHAFKYASKKVQLGIYDISENGNFSQNPLIEYGVDPDTCFNAFEALLNSDIRNTRHMGNFSSGKLWERNIRIFENCDTFDIEKTKEIFLHSKLFSAAGSLQHFNELSLRDNSNRQYYGREGWEATQKEIIKKLRIEQIEELLKIDVNYILPYLDNRGIRREMNEEENEDSKRRAKKSFIEIFGEEKIEELILDDDGKTVIDLIYELKDYELKDYELKADNISLHYFKILFNNQIVDKIEAKTLKDFFIKLEKGEDINGEFIGIMSEVYGEHAKRILESRPGLNVHSINSLEIFDKRIIDNFGEAFVHNLLSYNFEDFSEFLDIIKTPAKLENFKIYYEVLTNVLGDNIFTAQKAISEYNYIDKLLNNIRDIELTDEQYANLISIMLSEKNPYNIDTVVQLERYDDIVKEEVERELRQIENLQEDIPTTGERDRVDIKIEGIKEIILEKILGIDIFQWSKISKLYKFAVDKELYTEEEIKMIEIINFIINEENPTKLKKLVQEILNNKGLINPIVFHTTIQKTISMETEILNNNLMSREKMDIECEKEKGKEDPLIYKEIINGVEVYHLSGIEFSSLQTRASVDIKTFIEYDGQLSNSAICCRYRKNELIKPNSGQVVFVFSEVDDNMIIDSYDASGRDAMTSQRPKRIRMRGKINKNVANIPEMIYSKNEVAFYRRYLDKHKITNENLGGKRLPDFIVGGKGISDETYSILKKYNIGILVIHDEKYADKPKINDEKEKE